ncbi:hypothetical protein [Nonomuraea sp. LPB2021202275-12-8]|uniref:hypothetical protein n=1 Tax=Nonomuraea sp. LPB2021202275-12-8 TaxID=3120159 RepID=UPI00300C1038
MIRIPPRTATDAYFAKMSGSRRLDIVFDIDLGELLEGHHVVARGLEISDAGGVLHYEFVPGLRQHEMETKGPFFWYWTLSTEDDLGTPYRDDNGGAFDSGYGVPEYALCESTWEGAIEMKVLVSVDMEGISVRCASMALCSWKSRYIAHG